MAVLGLCCCIGFSLPVVSRVFSEVVVCEFLISVASLVAHGFCCSMACESFLGQGLNLCSLHWQGDS